MMKFLTSNQWVLIGVAGLLAAIIIFVVWKLQNRQAKKKVIETKGETKEATKDITNSSVEKYERVKMGSLVVPNAEIVDPVHRSIGLYKFEPLPNKDYGRVINVDGRDLFSLRISKDGSLGKIVHSTSMDHPTSELYRAIHTKDKIREVFGSHDDDSNKFKIGLLVAGGLIALFIMFMAIYRGESG